MTTESVMNREGSVPTAESEKVTSETQEQRPPPADMLLDPDSKPEKPVALPTEERSDSSPVNEVSEKVSTMDVSKESRESPSASTSTEPQVEDGKPPGTADTFSSTNPAEQGKPLVKVEGNRKMYGTLVVKKKKKQDASRSNGEEPVRQKSASQNSSDSAMDKALNKSSPTTSYGSDEAQSKGVDRKNPASQSTTLSGRSQASTVAKSTVATKTSQSPAPPTKPPPESSEMIEATKEAETTFEVITECIYMNKRLADADQDGEIMQCECRPNWNGKINAACGENTDCINRATRMECAVEDCQCGPDCQNMRFQRRQYADVSVVKADKKGYGLRANTFLHAHDFIYEYVGEVIDESRFRKRMEAYDKSGIKHFYFMSLKSGEFIDATKKGGYGRFCNHSCNPNCYVDKWVVGDKLRMGLFAQRDIRAGEELVFDYNVDRYGADPQPCYCGEPNCVGFIGGKTQTDAAPRLSHHVIEALGLEDDDVFVGKKARKPRKTGESDDDYIAQIPLKQLVEKDVAKVMSTLLHSKEQWVIHKVLTRIDRTPDEAVYPRVVRLHGYQILGRILSEHMHDDDMCLMALRILIKFPRMTKNKITSSRIEPTVQELAKSSPNEEVKEKAKELLQIWSKLETAFRIPRRVGQTPVNNVYNERQRKSRSKSKSPERPAPPTGPKSLIQQPQFPRGPMMKRPPRDLPWGWHKTFAPNQQAYYYANDGTVTWWKPSATCESKARLNGIPPPPEIPYVPLEREPLPENIAASERARKDKEFRLQLQREMEDDMRRREAFLEKKREEKREQEKKKEEEEKAARKLRHKQRAEYEKKKKYDHVERQVRKDMHAITGKYCARFLEGFEKAEIQKWHVKIDDILVKKTMRSVNVNEDSGELRRRLFERKHLDKVKSWVQDYCSKLIARRPGDSTKPSSSTPQPNSNTPLGEPTPFVSSTSATPVMQDDNTPADSALTTPFDKVHPLMVPMDEAETPEEVKESRKRAREDDASGMDSPKRRKSPIEA